MSESFSGLPEALQRALNEKGFTELTLVQKAVSEADSSERDLRISSQTGSGKTVAVGIAIARELIAAGPRESARPRVPEVLLLTPTRELASQVQRELAWLLRYVPDASVEVVTGGTSVLLEKKRLAGGPRVVVGTPGRALDHLTNGAFVGEGVRLVVLDEADQMLDMGFRDELEGILERLPDRGRTHLLSATFSGEVLAVAQRYQKDPIHLEGSPLGSANRDIEHVAHVVPTRHRYDALVNVLLLAHSKRGDDGSGRTLIFTRTRADTIELAERLQKDGVRAEPLSGDLAQAQRTRTLSAFRAGHVSTLVATDVAARGLDVQGVDLVVHFEPPGDSDTFTHRSGRTGRAGQKGTSVLLLPPQARRRVERLLHEANIRPSWAPVPSPEKIDKAFQKLGRRRIFQALENESEPEQLEYAQKLATEHPPERVIAALLDLLEMKPPCPAREVSFGFSPEHPGPGVAREPRHPANGPRGPGPRDKGPRGGFRDRGPRPVPYAEGRGGRFSDGHRSPGYERPSYDRPGYEGRPGPAREAGGFGGAPREDRPKGPWNNSGAPRNKSYGSSWEGAPREGGAAPAPREGARFGRPFGKKPNRPRPGGPKRSS